MYFICDTQKKHKNKNVQKFKCVNVLHVYLKSDVIYKSVLKEIKNCL